MGSHRSRWATREAQCIDRLMESFAEVASSCDFSRFVKHIRFGAWRESWCMLELFFFPLYLFYLSSLTVSVNLVTPSCPNCSLCSFYLRRISDLNQSQMALALSSGLLWRILELHLPCTILDASWIHGTACRGAAHSTEVKMK